jgi:predicted nucleic acid-binding Zn ribbon protein
MSYRCENCGKPIAPQATEYYLLTDDLDYDIPLCSADCRRDYGAKTTGRRHEELLTMSVAVLKDLHQRMSSYAATCDRCAAEYDRIADASGYALGTAQQSGYLDAYRRTDAALERIQANRTREWAADLLTAIEDLER